MKYSRGQEVLVKDHRRNSIKMRVWTETEKAVFVASEQVYEALSEGDSKWRPIGVDHVDVSPIDETQQLKLGDYPFFV